MSDPSPEAAKAISLMPVLILPSNLEDTNEDGNITKMTSIKFQIGEQKYSYLGYSISSNLGTQQAIAIHMGFLL